MQYSRNELDFNIFTLLLADKTENSKIVELVLKNMKKISGFTYKDADVPFKYHIWFAMFRRFPFAVAKMRNWMGIGL